MSPQAVGRRLRKVGELVRLCRALRIKLGSMRPITDVEAASLGGSADHLANDQVKAEALDPNVDSTH